MLRRKRGMPVLSCSGLSACSCSEAIARIVNQIHPGHARYLQVDDMTHGFKVNGKFCEELIPTILTWMREKLATGR
jgi:hypothetical protein